MRRIMTTMYEDILETLRKAGYDAGLSKRELYIERVTDDGHANVYRFENPSEVRSLQNLWENTLERLAEKPVEEVQKDTRWVQATEEILSPKRYIGHGWADAYVVWEEWYAGLYIKEEHSIPKVFWADSESRFRDAVWELERYLAEIGYESHEPTRLMEEFLATA